MGALSTTLRGGKVPDGFEATSDLHVAQGNAEEATLDHMHFRGGAKKGRSKERQQMEPTQCWTLNCGGLAGTWRLMHLLESLDSKSRPRLVFLQEVSCSDAQWINIQAFAKKIHYKGFFVGGKATGEKTGDWHRGVITFIHENCHARWDYDLTWEKGQLLAVVIDNILVINSYVVPCEEAIQEHTSKLEEYLIRCDWQGRWLMVGDWNEVYYGSWISTLSGLFGGYQANVDLVCTTRWTGGRTIDYPISNFELGICSTRSEAISDHCIVEFSLPGKLKMSRDHCRFVPGTSFIKPGWVTPSRWQELFDSAFLYEEGLLWREACYLTENFKEWEAEQDEEQLMVDYCWTFVMAQLSCTFRMAYWLALHEIPEDYEQLEEVRRVTTLINKHVIVGAEVKQQRRSLPQKGAKTSMRMAKMSKKLGRLHELARRIKRQQWNGETISLAKKLYDTTDVTLEIVNEDIWRLAKSISKSQEEEKEQKLSNWKQRIRESASVKSDWLNKKGSTMTPTVMDGMDIATTKQQAVGALREYWSKLWVGQDIWTEEILRQRTKEIVELLSTSTGRLHAGDKEARPSLALFQERMKRINGCAGVDAWSKNEIKVIAENNNVAGLVWKAMQLWEDTGKIPTAINCCKLVCIPKKQKRRLAPNQYRPICILSTWWRAWSSTWIRAPINRDWIEKIFPKQVAGGIPGSSGVEELSAVISHQLAMLGTGLSLDLSHAFDTVDLEMMRRVCEDLLPMGCGPWCRLLYQQWISMERWIVLDSAVAEGPLVTSHGIPQGDPAGPLMMNLLMLGLMRRVEQQLALPRDKFFHVLYMDDRTFIGSSVEMVNEAQKEWKETAERFKLKENVEKAQIVNTKEKNSSFEVLGTTIGLPTNEDLKQSRMNGRLEKAKVLYRKIGLLPINIADKIKDAGTFIKGVLSYGWISKTPTTKMNKAYETIFWRSLGKTMFSNPYLRRTLVGAHTSLSMTAGLKQMRILSKRNRILRQLGISKEQCLLDVYVASFLEELHWKQTDEGYYQNELTEEKFKLEDMLSDEHKGKIEHYVRESYRLDAYLKFCSEDRHEIRGEEMPVYSEFRRKAVVRWIGNNSTAMLAAIGGIQSPLLKFQLRGTMSYCGRCRAENPSWEHLWRCVVGEVPDDIMLRRFLWPRNRADYHLCAKMLDAICTSQ